MNEKLNVQDLIDSLSLLNIVSKEETEKFILTLFSTIELGLTTDELVKIKDFGTFKLTLIQERESVDVNTQEKIVIPSHRRVSFIPAQTLKSLVNKPFAHFETTPLNEGIILDKVEQEDTSNDEEKEDDDLIDENDYLPNKTEESTSILNTAVSDEKVDLMRNNPSFSTEHAGEYNKENDEKETSLDDSSNNKMGNIGENNEDFILKADTPIGKPKSTKVVLKSNEKPKRSFLPWYIAIAFLMIVVVLFAYNFYRPKDSPTKQDVEEREIPKPINESTPVVNDTLRKETAVPIKKPLETVQMDAGKTLRLIALDKYGSREFWVYIYLKNKDKIKNPDIIPVGIELELPREDEYDINPNNPESVAKAKKLGDEEMKKYW